MAATHSHTWSPSSPKDGHCLQLIGERWKWSSTVRYCTRQRSGEQRGNSVATTWLGRPLSRTYLVVSESPPPPPPPLPHPPYSFSGLRRLCNNHHASSPSPGVCPSQTFADRSRGSHSPLGMRHDQSRRKSWLMCTYRRATIVRSCQPLLHRALRIRLPRLGA